jgi:hypothetical protein
VREPTREEMIEGIAEGFYNFLRQTAMEDAQGWRSPEYRLFYTIRKGVEAGTAKKDAPE